MFASPAITALQPVTTSFDFTAPTNLQLVVIHVGWSWCDPFSRGASAAATTTIGASLHRAVCMLAEKAAASTQ